jgi:endoglucanase
MRSGVVASLAVSMLMTLVGCGPAAPRAAKTLDHAGRLPTTAAPSSPGASPSWTPSPPASIAPAVANGTRFYVDPESEAAQWVAQHPDDSRAAAIRDHIAEVPFGIWFSTYTPDTVTREVSSVTGRAASLGETPVLVLYTIPNRDCGGASAGGAPDLASYQTYVRNFAAGLGGAPLIVIVEPDGLALQDCLSAPDADARDTAIATAVGTLKSADPHAKVYLDAGHSRWNSAADQANRLVLAGIRHADGFFTNVSNFNSTANETAYSKRVLAALGNPGNLHAVIDISRNGNGPLTGSWCDPPGRRIGATPTTATGNPAIDAYLWVKPPGESDGCAAPAGNFLPDKAYAMVTG